VNGGTWVTAVPIGQLLDKGTAMGLWQVGQIELAQRQEQAEQHAIVGPPRGARLGLPYRLGARHAIEQLRRRDAAGAAAVDELRSGFGIVTAQPAASIPAQRVENRFTSALLQQCDGGAGPAPAQGQARHLGQIGVGMCAHQAL